MGRGLDGDGAAQLQFRQWLGWGLPYAGLIIDNVGNLDGTTAQGGNSFGQGGWTETVLYNFCSQTNCTDGTSPYGTRIPMPHTISTARRRRGG